MTASGPLRARLAEDEDPGWAVQAWPACPPLPRTQCLELATMRPDH